MTWLLWAGVIVAAPLIGIRWVDTTNGPSVVLQSVMPLTGIVVAILMVASVVTSRWSVTAAAGVLLTVCVVTAVPLLTSNTVEPGGDDVVVMSANLKYGEADAPSVVKAVREHRVDVLVLIEVTPAAAQRLSEAGLDTLLPQSAGRPRFGAIGSVIRGRLPMTLVDPGASPVSPLAADQPVVSIKRSGGDFVLRAVHPLAPLLIGSPEWRAGLADLQAWRERQPPSGPLVMVGDFNSSWGHPAFRSVAETLTDAHGAAGEGWVRTWPVGRRLIPPFVQLDHVLVRGFDVVDAGVLSLPKTDHAAVWTRLSPSA